MNHWITLNKKIKQITSILVLTIVLYGDISWLKASEKNVDTLVIAVMTDNPPFSMKTPSGEITGYHAEFWNLWAKVNNHKIKFVSGDYSQSLDYVNNGIADFHSGLFVNDERQETYAFSNSFDSIDNGLFYLKDSIRVNGLLDLEQKVVGIHPQYNPINDVKKTHPNIKLLLIDNVDMMIDALLKNKVSAIIGEVPFIQAQIERKDLQGIIALADELIATDRVSAMLLKNNVELVDLINDGIRNISSKALMSLEIKWLPNKSNYFNRLNEAGNNLLSINEISYLDSLKTLSVGIDPDWAPIEYFENTEHQGISSDYLRILSRALNKKLTPNAIDTWQEVLNKAKRKEIDILPAVTKRDANKNFLNYSKSYTSIALAIVVKRHTTSLQTADDLVMYRVGVTKDTAIHEILMREYPHVKLILSSKQQSGLDLLMDNEIEVFIGNLANINLRIGQSYPDLEVASILPEKLHIHFAVRKGLEALIPIINKVLDSVDSNERTKIRNTWLSIYLVQGTSLATYALWITPYLTLLLLISYIVNRVNKKLKIRISERVNAQILLEDAKEYAEKANRDKEQFLSNMSHEIRTPLNALMGMTHLLNQTNLSDEQCEYLDTMNHSANTLLLLVDDIVDLNKVESGNLKLEEKEFDFNKLIKNIEAQTRLTIINKDVRFDYNIDDNVPAYLVADQHRIAQILTNLISNAVKFTNKGCIKLNIHLLVTLSTNKHPNRDDLKQSVLQIELADTGIGMTDEQSKKLFMAYSQADKSTAREYGGTGLGLMISKKLCQLMGGEIWVNSKIGEGSRFIFTIKALSTDKEQSAGTKIEEEVGLIKNKLEDKHILVVDDNLINLTIVKKILTNQKIIVTTAIDGEKAVLQVKQRLLDGNMFDAILMDIQMPVMDGYEATKAIRKLQNKKQLPIIALSANVMQRDKDLAKECGMNEHLSKPVNVSLLLSTLTNFIASRNKES